MLFLFYRLHNNHMLVYICNDSETQTCEWRLCKLGDYVIWRLLGQPMVTFLTEESAKRCLAGRKYSLFEPSRGASDVHGQPCLIQWVRLRFVPVVESQFASPKRTLSLQIPMTSRVFVLLLACLVKCTVSEPSPSAGLWHGGLSCLQRFLLRVWCFIIDTDSDHTGWAAYLHNNNVLQCSLLFSSVQQSHDHHLN